jgi:ADP-heptose:LPS heptosyltransferase
VKILLVKLSSLGDIAQALPAVRRLAARTDGDIHWLVQPEYAALVGALPFVSKVLVWPRHGGLGERLSALRELRREKYDAVLDLQGLLKSALPASLARRTQGAEKYGLPPPAAREHAWNLYHVLASLPAEKRLHSADEMMAVVDAFAPPPAEGEAPLPPLDMRLPPLPVPPPEETGPWVVLAPFSRWETKNWPAGKFAETAKILRADWGGSFWILGGKGDNAQGERLAQAIGKGARNCCGAFNLLETCAVLHAADLLLAVDSGPLHWADALGTPAISIYGATDPARTGPYGQLDRVVAAEGLPCRPCHKRICANGEKPLACLEAVTPAAVAAVAAKAL